MVALMVVMKAVMLAAGMAEIVNNNNNNNNNNHNNSIKRSGYIPVMKADKKADSLVEMMVVKKAVMSVLTMVALTAEMLVFYNL
jgi:hypothetical protein